MDEPTRGLDVSVKARLPDLLRGLVRDLGLSVLIVTHDLAVVRLLAHRLMRMLWGNYLAAGGCIIVGGTDVATASPRGIIALRRYALGHISQFLRLPRVPTLEVVAEPLLTLGTPPDAAKARAAALLRRLNIPERLWGLSPTTFPGGEQQRVNIARGFARPYAALLLDEPTASLDATNREVVLRLIEEARARVAAVLGIFHDEAARACVCDRLVDVTGFTPKAVA
ncbi:ATP-binding cassette domain-containing protein [Paracoccus sp. MC1862]|nr:ATP-binding cassette domain-containing protein [Paracoccus sp. MC1862]QQO46267.1 ATP-binding cassette domain-containing protein [Paracoccus sp. MC1862]